MGEPEGQRRGSDAGERGTDADGRGGPVAQGSPGTDAAPGKQPARLPRVPAIVLSVLVGVLLGAGVFTIAYAEGLSYLSNDPEACVNCHIMREQYNGWLTSTHAAAATCNDCHVPHALLSKYIGKALNGWHHSSAFTMQDFDEPIRIKPGNAEVLEQNCRSCHQELVADISGHYGSEGDGPPCVHCHRSVGHGQTR